ncbi:hypothetical protein BDZ97DRAFT_1763874 [Flammula alnicola]|nr:hypothetical protein BDZ97DRAFT_1763874 [Flammula alnicola]
MYTLSLPSTQLLSAIARCGLQRVWYIVPTLAPRLRHACTVRVACHDVPVSTTPPTMSTAKHSDDGIQDQGDGIPMLYTTCLASAAVRCCDEPLPAYNRILFCSAFGGGADFRKGLLAVTDRGDNVNGLDPNDRTPDPERLLRHGILPLDDNAELPPEFVDLGVCVTAFIREIGRSSMLGRRL